MSTEAFIRQYFAGEKFEVALILLAGVVCLVLVLGLGSGVSQGVAVGLLLLAALGFTIDYVAQERAEIYLQQVPGLAP